MSIKGYKDAFSGIEPSKELHNSLLEAVLKEENEMKMEDRKKQARRTRRWKPGLIAACAAVMILCVSMTAAAAFDLNDIFQGFFKKEVAEEKNGNADNSSMVPLEAEDEFLMSAGNVINEETAGSGLKLTLRGTVGDGNALYAALDVETEDGSPFSEKQEKGIQSYRFEEVMLEGDGIEKDGLNMRYCGMERIDDGSVPGKATFLLSEVFEEDLKGKDIKLTLKNLMVESNDIIDIGMDKTIWELMQEFEPLKENQVYKSASGHSEDAEGNVSYYEDFMSAKTDKRIAFSSVFPEAALSNLGIWQGDLGSHLLVNLEFGGAWDADLANQKSLLVLDRRTGQELSSALGGGAIGNGYEEDVFPGLENQSDIVGKNTIISSRYCFNNISEESLKNAVFALGGVGSYNELFGGEWTLNFTVDYENTMKTWDLTEKAAAGNLEVKKIQISPVSGVVEFDTLSDEEVDFEDISLNLKNGMKVEANAMHWDSHPDRGGSCRVLWKSVVELEEIQSITVNGAEIDL